MYKISATGQTCDILDSEDRVCFTGTLRECEDWLDGRENQLASPAAAARSPAKSPAGGDFLHRWLAMGIKQFVRTRQWLLRHD